MVRGPMKKIILVLLLAGAVAGCYYYWKVRPAALAAKAEAQKPPTAKVERGPIKLTVASTGRVVANLDVEIKCKASGEVLELPYDVSDPVEKNKVLLKLDPVDEERNVKKAEADLASSQAKLDSARQNLLVAERTLALSKRKAEVGLKSAEAHARDARARSDRMAKLLEKKLASQEDADAAEMTAVQAVADLDTAQVKLEETKIEELSLELRRQDVKQAQTQVDSDVIDLALAKQRLADTTVAAPIQGVVTARNVQVGQIISSGISNVGGGTTVLTLSDLSRIFVIASVDESDIGKVEVGQAVVITADAYPGRRFRGKVARITPRGVVVSNVVTFEVKIEVLDPKKNLLKPEMTANVEILIAQKDDALTVPAEAVTRRKAQHVATVVKEDGTTEERTVEVGIQDGYQAEVTSGLKEGDVVLVRKGAASSTGRKAGGGPPSPMMFGPGGRGK